MMAPYQRRLRTRPEEQHSAAPHRSADDMPLHHVREILGHANISQTDTYLNAGASRCRSR